MAEGYREVVSSEKGARLSRDESARRLRAEIQSDGVKKIFRYPLNGIPKTEVKPNSRPT